MKGAGTRLARYAQFEIMDSDIDIARSLDTVAEEMCPLDDTTRLPFKINYNNESGEEIPESIIITIRSAIRQWTKKQDFKNRIYRMARELVKCGDAFYYKKSPLSKWQWIDPKNVLGIEIDEAGDPVAYHLTKGTVQTYGQEHLGHDVVATKNMVHFSLGDLAGGPSAPFGESLLQPIVRTYRQLAMLEDSILIYRLVRAPERRVFYIDVGNMPANKIKTYLENIKNDMRQRKIPNAQANDGNPVVDAAYNPMSTSEDYFFPVTSNGRGPRVETLPGGQNLDQLEELKFFQDKIFRGLRIPTSYMRSGEGGGAVYTDGKVGVAYIEELRFANFVKMLQTKMETNFDVEFKLYLKSINIKIDEDLFDITIPDPQNFAVYRQSALDGELFNTFQQADNIKYLSKRFIMKRYLQLSEDEIAQNEMLVKQERNIQETDKYGDLQQTYDPAIVENREAIKVEEIPDETDALPEDNDELGDKNMQEPTDLPPDMLENP